MFVWDVFLFVLNGRRIDLVVVVCLTVLIQKMALCFVSVLFEQFCIVMHMCI